MTLRDFVRRELSLVRRRTPAVCLGLASLVFGPFAAAAAPPPAYLETRAPELAGLEVGRRSSPELADLDGDGDLDLLTGTHSGGLVYFVNTGSSAAPAYVEMAASGNPCRGIATVGYSNPDLADLDGDGDLDLALGVRFGAIRYFANTGSPLVAHFRERTGSANPFAAAAVGSSASPELVDLDGDGDLDAVIGESASKITYFRNTGSSSAPAFVALTGGASPFSGLAFNYFYALTPVLADLDGDGDRDMLIGESYGNVFFSRNTGSSSAPAFQGFGPAPFGTLHVGSEAVPAFGDLDGDGDRDLVAGNVFGDFTYFEQTGSAAAPAFAKRTGAASPFDGGFRAGGGTSPELADVDHDGDLDALVGAIPGELHFFRNTGNAVAPAFAAASGTGDPFADIATDFGADPAALADLDGDGDFDVAIGDYDGTLHYFENTGSDAAPAHLERTGTANPFNGFDAGMGCAPELADLDGDGDRDAVLGHDGSPPVYLENTGTTAAPAFLQRTGAANPLAGVSLAGDTLPALADLDGDGDLDFLAGTRRLPLPAETLVYYENTGTPSAPAFVQRTGSANPLATHQYHWWPLPTAGDLDGDGATDLLLGELDGRVIFLKADKSGIFADGFESGGTGGWSAVFFAGDPPR